MSRSIALMVHTDFHPRRIPGEAEQWHFTSPREPVQQLLLEHSLNSLEDSLANHGQRLRRLANHDGDFRCCAAVNHLAVVPTQMHPEVFGLV